MGLIATKEDFEPDTNEHRPLYFPAYTRFEEHAVRADYIVDNYGTHTCAVWGCAFGYLVDELVERSVDAIGFDASFYAIERGKELLPNIASRLHRLDCKYDKLDRFELCVTEDMLPCLNDREIQLVLPRLRASADKMLHIVSPHGHGIEHDERINWKTLEEWQELLMPDKAVGPLCQ